MRKINLSEVSKTAILTLIGKSAGHKSRFIQDKKSLTSQREKNVQKYYKSFTKLN